MDKSSSAADTQIGSVAELDAYIAAKRAGEAPPSEGIFQPMGRRAQAAAKRKQVLIERPPPPPKPKPRLPLQRTIPPPRPRLTPPQPQPTAS